MQCECCGYAVPNSDAHVQVAIWAIFTRSWTLWILGGVRILLCTVALEGIQSPVMFFHRKMLLPLPSSAPTAKETLATDPWKTVFATVSDFFHAIPGFQRVTSRVYQILA